MLPLASTAWLLLLLSACLCLLNRLNGFQVAESEKSKIWLATDLRLKPSSQDMKLFQAGQGQVATASVGYQIDLRQSSLKGFLDSTGKVCTFLWSLCMKHIALARCHSLSVTVCVSLSLCMKHTTPVMHGLYLDYLTCQKMTLLCYAVPVSISLYGTLYGNSNSTCIPTYSVLPRRLARPSKKD